MIKVFSNEKEYDEESLSSNEDSESDSKKATTTAKNIIITPIEQVVEVVPQVNNSVIDEILSETDTEPGNPLSKTKLKAMNLEKLKAICVHHQVSAEGSKSVLIARLLGESRD